jgi:signal transduction histidine kinase
MHLNTTDAKKENQEVAIRVFPEGETTRIEIADNGLGIAAEHHEKIFEMFYRASEQSQGSGLGLYIVRETLTRLSGTIQLKSALGQGSTFTLWLPNHL